LERERLGRTRLARIAIIATTTNNSINVNPTRLLFGQ
jgi:hypothetical protein